jgi:hypothetical protein
VVLDVDAGTLRGHSDSLASIHDYSLTGATPRGLLSAASTFLHCSASGSDHSYYT